MFKTLGFLVVAGYIFFPPVRHLIGFNFLLEICLVGLLLMFVMGSARGKQR